MIKTAERGLGFLKLPNFHLNQQKNTKKKLELQNFTCECKLFYHPFIRKTFLLSLATPSSIHFKKTAEKILFHAK